MILIHSIFPSKVDQNQLFGPKSILMTIIAFWHVIIIFEGKLKWTKITFYKQLLHVTWTPSNTCQDQKIRRFVYENQRQRLLAEEITQELIKTTTSEKIKSGITARSEGVTEIYNLFLRISQNTFQNFWNHGIWTFDRKKINKFKYKHSESIYISMKALFVIDQNLDHWPKQFFKRWF